MNTKQKNMALSTNIKAPHFAEKDVYDRLIDLNHYKGKKIFLGFFRHAGCPFCNLRVHTLTKVHQELKEKGLEMIFFFESKKEIVLRSSFHQGVSPIPIISDPTKKYYSMYGLEPSTSKAIVSHLTTFVQTAWKAKQTGVPLHLMASGESFSTMPAEFLIDSDLTVKKVHYADSLTDRMNTQDIFDFARG